MTEYVDQSADDLRFHLLRGYIDVTRYTVLETADMQWNDVAVTAGILGASHFLRLGHDEHDPLYEIFACAEVTTDLPFITSGPLGELQTKVESTVGDFAYSFAPRLRSWSSGEAELEQLIDCVQQARTADGVFGLMYEFPSPDTGTKSRRPLTAVYGGVAHSSFVLRTAHCYPNEAQVVFTKTTVRRRSS